MVTISPISRFFTAVILILSCCFFSCKKSDNKNASSNNYADPMLPESSGWKRVGYVNNSGTYIDQNQPAQMTAYDLQVNTSLNTVQVIYSEDKLEPFDKTAQYYKASFIPGKPADSTSTTMLAQPFFFAAGPPDELVHRFLFRPGTYSVNDLIFYHYDNRTHYDFMLRDEQTTLVTSQGPFFDATHNMKILPSGDLIGGDVNIAGLCELDYYHADTRSWDFLNQSAGDTQFAIAYTPFKLDDGAILAWRMYSKNGKAYLSIADFNYSATYPTAPYIARFTEEHPEYAPSGIKPGSLYTPVFPGKASVVAYTTSGNSVTVVVAYKDDATSAYTLSAFKWTEGTRSFQQLYHGVSISSATGDMFTNFRTEFGCTPEGTAFTIIRDQSNHYHLSLTDASGERNVADVITNASSRQAAFMSCLRYVNGAYYAVVTPFFSGVDYKGQHLDVVKYTP